MQKCLLWILIDSTMKIRFFSLLFALCLSVSGLYAQGRAVAPVVPSAETLQKGGIYI